MCPRHTSGSRRAAIGPRMPANWPFPGGMQLAFAPRMRILGLLGVLVAVTSMACGGSTSGTGDPTAPGTTPPSHNPNDPPSSNPPISHNDAPKIAGADCPSPTTVLVGSGGVIARPVGSVLRLQMIYQGSSMGVTDIRGADMVIYRGDGPFTPGVVAGYWVEAQTSAKATLYQRTFQDPTSQEAFPGPGGGGFSNSTIDRCV